MWERVICFIIMVLAALCTFAATQEFEPKTYCLYGDTCWPSKEVFDQLQADYPTMTIIRKGALGWEEASDLVLNRRVAKTPGATIYVTSVSDIIAVVNFTKFYNMDLKLISSGHEFIGRNTAEGCLQMSLAKMTDTSIDLSCQENSAGCMTAEPGVLWLQAYREVDVVNRIILGGAEPTVSVTGWSLGGGHSPYSPKLGLGADHIIELSMVLADLSLVTMNKDGMVKRLSNGTTTSSDETDLFWAIGNSSRIITRDDVSRAVVIDRVKTDAMFGYGRPRLHVDSGVLPEVSKDFDVIKFIRDTMTDLSYTHPILN
ncbi:uncharacterized protein [Watersipora subatra]|uniref:uncharacterized protein n=1 Tax=Watersipora subatra TaxID=2589382 RepID=UPI00355B2546